MLVKAVEGRFEKMFKRNYITERMGMGLAIPSSRGVRRI
jgi:hypothetical protein